MKLMCGVLALVSVGSVVGLAFAQLPDQFVLHQNEPNPFCNTVERSDTSTTILYEVPQLAHVVIQAWSPDTLSVVRTIVDWDYGPGLYGVLWDGRDYSGMLLPDGYYPYVMVATEPEQRLVLFADTLIAQIDCETSMEGDSWGRVKVRYRDGAQVPSND